MKKAFIIIGILFVITLGAMAVYEYISYKIQPEPVQKSVHEPDISTRDTPRTPAEYPLGDFTLESFKKYHFEISETKDADKLYEEIYTRYLKTELEKFPGFKSQTLFFCSERSK